VVGVVEATARADGGPNYTSTNPGVHTSSLGCITGKSSPGRNSILVPIVESLPGACPDTARSLPGACPESYNFEYLLNDGLKKYNYYL
jgi:hypothetical protein